MIRSVGRNESNVSIRFSGIKTRTSYGTEQITVTFFYQSRKFPKISRRFPNVCVSLNTSCNIRRNVKKWLRFVTRYTGFRFRSGLVILVYRVLSSASPFLSVSTFAVADVKQIPLMCMPVIHREGCLVLLLT